VIKSKKMLAAAALAAAIAPIAAAGEVQLSAGGEYLFDSADSEFAFTGVTARGAYYFNENVGVEVEGTTGTSGADNYANSGLNFDLKSQYGAYVVGRMAAGTNGELFGRVGFRAGTFDVTGNFFGPISDSIDYNGFSIGGGYTYFFNKSVGLRGEVTTSGASLDNNFSPDGNLTSLALSLVVKLGNK
jgi:hypothetical protein